MPLEVGSVFTRLGFKADDSEATRYERRVEGVRGKTRTPIHQKLSFDADEAALSRYERRVEQARAKARTPVATAVAVDTRQVENYDRSVSQADGTTRRFTQTLAGLTGAASGAGGAIGGGAGLTGRIGGLSGALGPVLGILLSLLPLMVAVGGAAVALGSSLAAAAAGAGAVGIGIAAVAGPLAMLAGSIIGRVGLISDAYDALSAQQEKGASTARTSAAAQQAAAQAIKQAEQSLGDARRSAGQSIEDAERALEDARAGGAQSVQDAERRLASVRRDGAQTIRDAEDALASARITGQEAVRAAERSLADALAGATRARQNLTDAEGRAVREREQLAASAKRTRLDEEGARLALEQARARLTELQLRPHTQLELKEAQYAVKVAIAGIEDAAAARRRADEDQRRGSTAVKDARDALTEANKRVADAERGVAEASRDAAATRQRAENEYREAIDRTARERRSAEQEIAQARTAASEQVEDARRALARTEADSARSVTRAQEQVRLAREAATAATVAQSAAADTAAAKLAKLSDTERRLLVTVRSFGRSFRDAFAPATDAIFNGVDRGLRRVEPLLGRYRDRFTGIGEEIGNLIDRAARNFAGPEWTNALDQFVATARRVTRPLGEALGSGLEVLRDIAVAAQPYVIEFAEYLRDALGRLADATGDADGLDGVIKDLVDSTKDWWHFLVAVGDLLITIFGGGKEEGDNLVETMTKIVRRWDEFLETEEGQDQLKEFFRDAIQATKDLAKALGDLVGIIFWVSRQFMKINNAWTDVEIALQRGSLAVAQEIRGWFVWAIDGILGAFTTLMGGFSTVASALGRLPGGGRFKEIAGAIDGARDSMDGFRKSLRDGNDELGRRQNIKLMQREVTVLRERLSHLDKGSEEYRQTAEKLRSKQRVLNDALGDAQAAGRKGAKGPVALAKSASNSLAVIDDANAGIVSSYNQIAGQLGDLKPLRFRASKKLKDLADDPSGISDKPPVPGLDRKAVGGWIGSRGPQGPDDQLILAGTGEAVVNTDQQGPVEEGLALRSMFMGGPANLDQLFGAYARGGRIRRYARGGMVSGDTDYSPALGRALEALARAAGRTIHVQSGGRTMAEQAALVRSKGLYGPGNPTGAAAPSPNAPHIAGRAADITPGREALGRLAARFGLSFPLPGEPWHIELGGGRAGAALSAMVQRIRAPHIEGPEGRLRSMMQRSVTRLAGAANDKLAAAAGAAEGGGPGGGDSSASADVVAAFRRAISRGGASRVERLALWMAGIVESGLRNLPYGDRDSVGALQQRASQGWTGLMDPFRAAMEFISRAKGLRPWRSSAGQLAQAVQRSAYPERYDAVRAQAMKYMRRGGRVGGLQRFASGGFIGSKAYNNLRKMQGNRVKSYDRAQDQLERLQSDYSYKDRSFNLSDEVLVDPETGDVNVEAVNKRAAELQQLVTLRERIVAKLAHMRKVIARIQTTYRTMIKRMRAALRKISRKTKGGRERRATYTNTIERYTEELADWGEKGDSAFDSWRDADLDLQETRQERAEVLGTQSTAQPTEDTPTDTGSTDTGASSGGDPALTPAQVAAAAAELFQTFQAERADMFRNFGSNNVARGTDPFGNPTSQAAGMQFFGAAGGSDMRAYAGPGGRVTYIESAEFKSEFGGSPPSGDTYVQQQAREVGLAFQ